MFKVKALYDFEGESNTAEICIRAGEVLIVNRVDIGEGWWEGVNAQGKSGLFPEAYVQRVDIDTQPPSAPPPVLPPQTNEPQRYDNWDNIAQQPQQQDDDTDDEWDNEDTYTEIGGVSGVHQKIGYPLGISGVGGSGMNSDNISEASYQVDVKGVGGGGGSGGTLSKKNWFSAHGKSGVESYVLGTLKDTVQPIQQRPQIVLAQDNLYQWLVPRNESYSVLVTSPKKATKMGGLKSFIAYQLTPSFTNIEVSRRYKHFDWLHTRLCEKFAMLAVPPLPDKQISGRYEEHFIEHRRVQLQAFVNYVSRHPVMSQCEVWMHFLTCTADEKHWKEGKRRAEKDQFIGANFCLCLDAPDKDLLASNVDSHLELNTHYIMQMEQSIKGMIQMTSEQMKGYEVRYKRENMKIGECFLSLGAALDLQNKGMFTELSTDIKTVGATYAAIGKLYEEQAKIDWQPLSDQLYLYRGITNSFADVFTLQKHAEQKRKETERNGQIQSGQLNEVRRRTDVLTYVVFAELEQFQHEMQTEFRNGLRDFLKEQVNFYKNIVGKLEDTLKRFE